MSCRKPSLRMAMFKIRLLLLLFIIPASSTGAVFPPRPRDADVSGSGSGGGVSARADGRPDLRERGYPSQSSQGMYDEERMLHENYEAGRLRPERVFQITPPVLGPNGAVRVHSPRYLSHHGGLSDETANEQIELVRHSFRTPEPLVVQYTPPKFRTFNRVLLNITVVTEGIQIDHLATLSLGDIEIWRMFTAQSKPKPGAEWTFSKDMTTYLSLWKQPQKLIFQVGNLVNDIYTAPLNVTMKAIFFEKHRSGPNGAPADRIIPLNAQRGSDDKSSAWEYPKQQASNLVLFPRNVNRAHASIAATAQGEEEYWWSNVPDSKFDLFENTTGILPAGSGVREIRLSIDGHPAGMVWPFPVVSPGGIGIPMNRPTVPIQAFDLRESEIDISPWLPYLCDGKRHNLTLDIFQFDDRVKDTKLKSVKVKANHWLINAKIFLWLDKDEGSITTGTFPKIVHHSLRWNTTRGDVTRDYKGHPNGTVYDFNMHRMFRIETKKVKSQHRDSEAGWIQEFRAESKGLFTLYGFHRTIEANYKGRSQSFTELVPSYHESFEYPITAVLDYRLAEKQEGKLSGPGPFSIDARFAQIMISTVVGNSAFSMPLEPWLDIFFMGQRHVPGGSSIHASRHGTSSYYQNENGTQILGLSSSLQSYRLGMAPHNIDTLPPGFISQPLLYRRDVTYNGTEGFRDEEWTYGLHDPYDYEPWLPSAGKLDENDGHMAQQREKFAPVGPSDTHRLFLGHLQPLLGAGAAEKDLTVADTKVTSNATEPYSAPTQTRILGWD